MRRPASLQGRLLVLVLGLVAAVWLAAAAQTWFDVRHELDELLDAHLAQAAALLVAQQSHELDENHALDSPTLHRYAPKVAFQVFHEGRLVLRSANAPLAPMVGADQPMPSGYKTVLIGGTAWRVFAAFGAERDVQVYVGEQVDSRDAILRAVLRSTLLPLALALPLLALAAWWAIHRGMAPLRQLAHGLTQRAPDALEAITVSEAPAEMRPMIDALNRLFQRIGEMMAFERRFTADAAHELRTPIAAIRAQAQVALGASDDRERRHALTSTLEGCDRATRLVQQLLTLSRLEAGTAPAGAPVDLAALVRQVVGELAPLAIQKAQHLEVDAPDTACQVQGDVTLLGVLVRNLADNAIRYSPTGAMVKISVAAPQGEVRLSVEDSGPGLSEPDQQRLGERFFRVLGSGQGGSGLGWSIVRRIAAAHSAQISVARSVSLGGLAVSVSWPG